MTLATVLIFTRFNNVVMCRAMKAKIEYNSHSKLLPENNQKNALAFFKCRKNVKIAAF